MTKVKKCLDVASTVALVLFIGFVILLVGVRLFGIQPHIVLSGSMEPEIRTGALVYVKPITREEACNLKEGDTITYLVDSRGTKVTHRIYEVVGEAYVKNQYGEPILDANGQPQVAKDADGYPIVMYVTYGINNKNSSDPSGYTLDGTPGVGNLASSNVVGKPVFSIPFLGYVAHFVQNPPGKFVAIGLCFLLVGYSLLSGFFKKEIPAGEGSEPAAEAAVPAETADPAKEAEADADKPAEDAPPADGSAEEPHDGGRSSQT